MPVDIKTGFHDGDTLRDIRTILLNPIAVKVEALEGKVVTLREDTDKALRDAIVNTSAKTISFPKGAGAPKEINLTGMFREGSDLEIVDGTGVTFQNISRIQAPDTKITQVTAGEAELHYEWDKIVPRYQSALSIGKSGASSPIVYKPKALYFKGDLVDVENTSADITTVVVKSPEPLKASIPGGSPPVTTPVPITKIELEGETSNSVIQDGKLTIHLSKGGSGVSNDNFKGIFESLGDLESKVQDPINGKSFAYVKDQTLGGKYYTAHYYVSNNWKELSQDPALTYNAPTASVNQGVFSIKPSDKITIDSTGQLNLDGLSTPQLPQYFVGFFDTLEELKDQVKRPVPYQSFAYVKGVTGRGWLTYRADTQGSASLWKVVAPLGSFSYVDEDARSYTQVFGIKKSDGWTLDGQGILSLQGSGGGGPGGPLSVSISDYNNQSETHNINSISFNRGKSFAEFTGSKKDHVLIDHPQRIINYNNSWELAHNSQDYEGNIFYDETSRCWMGYSIPKDPGAVGAKWTRIAHEDMSLEVKDLVKRLPAKSKTTTAGIIGDSADWAYNGTTFLDQGDQSLPTEFRDECGGYVTTVVQDKDASGVTIPQYRSQTCTADKEGGDTYARRFIATGSGGAAVSWSPWVRISFSKKDINAHENDPAAHKNVIKYHKVTSVSGKFTDILAQYGGPGGASTGFIRGSNCDLLVDNYGYTQGTDYLEFPYSGNFRIRCELFVSGYVKNNYPVSTWSVILMKESKDGSQALLGQYQYEHKINTVKYPPIFFIANDVSVSEGDKVYIRLRCPESTAINAVNPHIYFVPLKSQIIVEDMGTLAGTKIGETYKKHLANLNTFGEIEVKAHYNDFDSSRAVRIYGDKVVKTPIEMRTL